MCPKHSTCQLESPTSFNTTLCVLLQTSFGNQFSKQWVPPVAEGDYESATAIKTELSLVRIEMIDIYLCLNHREHHTDIFALLIFILVF